MHECGRQSKGEKISMGVIMNVGQLFPQWEMERGEMEHVLKELINRKGFLH